MYSKFVAYSGLCRVINFNFQSPFSCLGSISRGGWGVGDHSLQGIKYPPPPPSSFSVGFRFSSGNRLPRKVSLYPMEKAFFLWIAVRFKFDSKLFLQSRVYNQGKRAGYTIRGKGLNVSNIMHILIKCVVIRGRKAVVQCGWKIKWNIRKRYEYGVYFFYLQVVVHNYLSFFHSYIHSDHAIKIYIRKRIF